MDLRNNVIRWLDFNGKDEINLAEFDWVYNAKIKA